MVLVCFGKYFGMFFRFSICCGILECPFLVGLKIFLVVLMSFLVKTMKKIKKNRNKEAKPK